MAHLAIRRELSGDVIRVRRGLEVLGVTRITLRRKPLELPRGRTGVARITIHGGVSAYKREPILVVLNGPDRHVPALHGVALLAVSPHLAAVNIGMAVRALGADVAENELHVTLSALNLLVHPPQRVTRLVVVELRNAADRFPTRKSVAILAGNCDVSVRVFRVTLRRRPSRPLCENSTRGE